MAAFATNGEVATRLGRELTEAEEAQADAVLATVAGLIRSAAGQEDDWDPDPVHPLFPALSIEKAIGVLSNPQNLVSQSETLGVHQHSETFSRGQGEAPAAAVFLTDAEERDVRRAAEISALGAIEYEAWPPAVGASLDFAEGS